VKKVCIVCHKVYGESGDLANGSVTGGICEDCEKLLDSYYYCRRQYKKLETTVGLGIHRIFGENLKQGRRK